MSGAVRVRIPGVLRPEAGGAGVLEVGGGTVRSVLDELAARWPRLERRVRDETGEIRRYINVYVDGADVRRLAGQDTAVPAGAELHILPSVAGGSGSGPAGAEGLAPHHLL